MKKMIKTRTIKEEMDKAFNSLDVYNYIESNPIQVVHEMASRNGATIADIEICAIWAAMLAWGDQQKSINDIRKLMDMCSWDPANFVRLGDFYDIDDEEDIHLTIQGEQFKAVNHNLRATYNAVTCVADYAAKNCQTVNELIKDLAMSLKPARLGSPARNSSCKRINLLLRWFIRKDNIDLGIWQTPYAKPSDLYAIMDARVAKQAMKMGLMSYSQYTWNAVIELTDVYRSWDRKDPLKYDLVFMSNEFRK